ANGLVVDGRYRLVTARTKALCALYGRQFQHRPGLAAPILLTPIPYAITLPATQLGHTIHFGHGRPRVVASRTTILPGRPCASLPSVGRRTKKKLPLRLGNAEKEPGCTANRVCCYQISGVGIGGIAAAGLFLVAF